jgi:hypothetical protein
VGWGVRRNDLDARWPSSLHALVESVAGSRRASNHLPANSSASMAVLFPPSACSALKTTGASTPSAPYCCPPAVPIDFASSLLSLGITLPPQLIPAYSFTFYQPCSSNQTLIYPRQTNSHYFRRRPTEGYYYVSPQYLHPLITNPAFSLPRLGRPHPCRPGI